MPISFIAKRTIDKEGIEKIELIAKKYLAHGSFGIIFKAIVIGQKEHIAIKQAKSSPNARLDLYNEVKMLNLAHDKNPNPNQPLRGIQERPLTSAGHVHIFNTKTNRLIKKRTHLLYFGKLYKKKDLRSYFHKNTQTKLIISADLAAGCAHLAKIGIYHGDLKPANVLANKSNGKRTGHVSDFGGTIELNKENGNWRIRSYTPQFTHPELQNTMRKAKIARLPSNNETVEKVQGRRARIAPQQTTEIITTENAFEVFEKAALRNDVFALGVTLYIFFSGDEYHMPFKSDTNQAPIVSDKSMMNFRYFSRTVPREVKDLIRKMLEVKENPNLTMQDVSAVLDKYVQH